MPRISELKKSNSRYSAGGGPRFTLSENFLRAISSYGTFSSVALRILAKPTNLSDEPETIDDTGYNFSSAYLDYSGKRNFAYKANNTSPYENSIDVTSLVSGAINDINRVRYLEIQPIEGKVKFFYNNADPIYKTVDYVSWNINVNLTKKTKPTNINFPATSDTRNTIPIAWDNENQDLFEVDIVQNGIVVHRTSGTTAKVAYIPPNTLVPGTFTVNLTTAVNPFDDWGEGTSITKDLIATSSEPKILGLEPDGIERSADGPIDVNWVSAGQQVFTLRVFAGDVLKNTYQGATQTSVRIPAQILPKGTIKLELSISNTVNNVTLSAYKEARFLCYGKPDKPIYEERTIYTQALPAINWTAPEQVVYKFEIRQAGILKETSGEVISANQQYKVMNALINNTDYSLSLSVKNKFGLWSDVSEKNITISYTEIPKPEFTLISSDSNILVTINYPTTVTTLKSLEIWRGDETEGFVRKAFNLKATSQWLDSTVASGISYRYKVRAIANDGGISESDTFTASAFVKHFVFENIETKETKILIKNPEITISTEVDITTRKFAGASKLKVERGKKNYKRMNCSFIIESSQYASLEQFLRKGKVILFRNRRGEKFYGAVTSSLNATYIGVNSSKVSFAFEEVNFIEKDIYSETKLVLTYFNGEYFFNGAIDFSGVNLQ